MIFSMSFLFSFSSVMFTPMLCLSVCLPFWSPCKPHGWATCSWRENNPLLRAKTYHCENRRIKTYSMRLRVLVCLLWNMTIETQFLAKGLTWLEKNTSAERLRNIQQRGRKKRQGWRGAVLAGIGAHSHITWLLLVTSFMPRAQKNRTQHADIVFY